MQLIYAFLISFNCFQVATYKYQSMGRPDRASTDVSLDFHKTVNIQPHPI